MITTTEALGFDIFKETELGPLPTDWKIVQLGGIAEYINGYAFDPSQWGRKGLPIIRIQNLTGNSEKMNYFDGEIPERYRVRNDDLLVSWSASIGVFLWQRGDAWLNQHIFKVDNIATEVSKSFLFFVLQYYLSSITEKTRGTTMKHITRKEFLAISIPLPPLKEQRRIAHVLNTIQREIAAQDKLISAAREVKRSLMQRLFTYGPGAEPAPTKETEIGEVPEHWEISTIGKLCDKGGGTVQTGPFGSQLHASDYVPSGIPSVMPQDIVDNRIVEINIARISKKDHQRLSRYHLCAGDIVYARRGDIGRRALVGKEQDGWLCGTGSLFIRVGDSNIEPLFLHYYLGRPEVNTYILAQAVGTTMLNLNTQILKSVPVVYPSIEEQRLIAQMLNVTDRKIAAEEQRKSALQALFKSMLHQLMTGQVRVKETGGKNSDA